jgi:hypothetical protein
MQQKIPFGDDNWKDKGKGQQQGQRLGGWRTVYIPPIAECAMDGAPVLLWLGKEGKGQGQLKRQRQSRRQ